MEYYQKAIFVSRNLWIHRLCTQCRLCTTINQLKIRKNCAAKLILLKTQTMLLRQTNQRYTRLPLNARPTKPSPLCSYGLSKEWFFKKIPPTCLRDALRSTLLPSSNRRWPWWLFYSVPVRHRLKKHQVLGKHLGQFR